MKPSGDREIEPLRERVKSGIAFGAAFSAFVPIILLIMFFEGVEFQSKRTLLHGGVLVVTYPLGAMITGALLMSLQPYLRWTPLAVLWGAISMVPWMAGIALAADRGYADWTAEHTWITALMSLGSGGTLGYFLRKTEEKPGQKKKRRKRRAVAEAEPAHALDEKPATVGPYSRRACPCCGFPTLGDVDEPQACTLCAWEEGGDIPLARARRNFRRFGSACDPGHLQSWIGAAQVTDEEAATKEDLVRVYRQIEEEPDSLLLWDEALELEARLQRMRVSRAQLAEESWSVHDGADE